MRFLFEIGKNISGFKPNTARTCVCVILIFYMKEGGRSANILNKVIGFISPRYDGESEYYTVEIEMLDARIQALIKQDGKTQEYFDELTSLRLRKIEILNLRRGYRLRK